MVIFQEESSFFALTKNYCQRSAASRSCGFGTAFFPLGKNEVNEKTSSNYREPAVSWNGCYMLVAHINLSTQTLSVSIFGATFGFRFQFSTNFLNKISKQTWFRFDFFTTFFCANIFQFLISDFFFWQLFRFHFSDYFLLRIVFWRNYFQICFRK